MSKIKKLKEIERQERERRISSRCVKDYDLIDWSQLLFKKTIDYREGYVHVALKDDDDYKDFVKLFKQANGSNIYYPKYCELISKAYVLYYKNEGDEE